MDKIKIEQLKQIERLKKEIKKVVPEVYACFAKVLYEKGWEADQIEDLFMLTQKAWNESYDHMEGMLEWVSETTGIDVRGEDYI